MPHEADYSGLIALLSRPRDLVSEWSAAVVQSPIRLPNTLESAPLQASLAPIIEAFSTVVAPDRNGRRPSEFDFEPGSVAMREVEQALAFTIANFAAKGASGFFAAALILCLRDLLCAPLTGSAHSKMARYMDWLVAMTTDSLATGRERAALERWDEQLDEGTPLVMITPELPAALFVCAPNARVVSGVFARLTLTLVRTGASAAIIDVRGMAERFSSAFGEALNTFLGNERVAKRIRVIACGVHVSDVALWQEIGERHGVDLRFENYFDSCVQMGLEAGDWRLLPPG